MAAIRNPEAVIHAFEPASEIASTFQVNVALNQAKKIVVNTQAIGAHNESGYFIIAVAQMALTKE